MADIQLFNFQAKSFSVVIDEHNNPWFLAKDVCRVLGLDNVTMAVSRLDDDEVTLITVEGASNGLPVNAVNESGLYSLVLTSRKPEAKTFKRWITHEVLPQIRKTGAYHISPPQTNMEMLQVIVNRMVEQERHERLQDERIDVLELENKSAKVDAEQADRLYQIIQLWGKELGGKYGLAFNKFKQHFGGIAKHTHLPRHRYDEAIRWLQTQIDKKRPFLTCDSSVEMTSYDTQ